MNTFQTLHAKVEPVLAKDTRVRKSIPVDHLEAMLSQDPHVGLCDWQRSQYLSVSSQLKERTVCWFACRS